MSASAVKPVLPASGAGGQATGTPNSGSPLKNHTASPLNIPLTLAQEKSPDRSKDTAGPKPTSNGVDPTRDSAPIVVEENTHNATAPPNQNTAATANGSPSEKLLSVNHSPPPVTSATPPKVAAQDSQPTTVSSNISEGQSSPVKTASIVTTPPSDSKTEKTHESNEKESKKTDEEKPDGKENAGTGLPNSSTVESASSTTPKRGSDKVEKEKASTVPRVKRKREPAEASSSSDREDSARSKRTRVPVQPYQSPMPDLFMSKPKPTPKTPEVKEKDKEVDKERLVIFYKNEFLAVRNSEGGFYVCQAMQNVYKSSPKIRIRWMSEEENKSEDAKGSIYSPDFYDSTDFDCILTNLTLTRVDKNRYQLPKGETERTENILKRALDVEKGVEKPDITEEHPDGLDLSLFRDEAQLKKRKSRAKASATSPKRARQYEEEDSEDKPKTERNKRAAASPRKKGANKRASQTKTPGKSTLAEKKASDEDKGRASAKRAERASEREKAREKTPSGKRRGKVSEEELPSTSTSSPVKAAAKTPARSTSAASGAPKKTPAKAQTASARKTPSRGRKAESSGAPTGRNAKTRSTRTSGAAEKMEDSDPLAETDSTINAVTDSTTATAPTSTVSPVAAPVASATPVAAVPETPASRGSVTPAESIPSPPTPVEGDSPSIDAATRNNRGAKKPTGASPGKKA